jgi:hypothetical protein
LQDAKGIQIYGIDEPYHEEEHMAPSVVRQAAPINTNSEGARVHRESALKIQETTKVSNYVALMKKTIDLETF